MNALVCDHQTTFLCVQPRLRRHSDETHRSSIRASPILGAVAVDASGAFVGDDRKACLLAESFQSQHETRNGCCAFLVASSFDVGTAAEGVSYVYISVVAVLQTFDFQTSSACCCSCHSPLAFPVGYVTFLCMHQALIQLGAVDQEVGLILRAMICIRIE